MHFRYLNAKISQAFEEGATDLLVDLDQKSSGLAFFSLLIKNRRLAKCCKLLQSEDHLDLEEYVRGRASKALHSIGAWDPSLFAFLFHANKMHGLAFLSFLCGQNSGRRLRYFLEFEDPENKLTESGRKALGELSKKYGEFLDYLFPGVIKQLALLNEARDLLLGVQKVAIPTLTLGTVDESVFCWGHQKEAEFVGKFNDPWEKKFLSYRGHDCYLDEGDRARMERSFIAALIQSLDAGVARLVALKLGELGLEFQVNHDCFRLRPRDVPTFYRVVKEVFMKPDFNDLLQIILVRPNESHLESAEKEKLHSICSKIASGFEFTWDGKDFAAAECYVPKQ